jgi:hypothetical protein
MKIRKLLVEFKLNLEISSEDPLQMSVTVRIMQEVGQMGSGKSFGEKSIDDNKTRAATVYVKSQ